MVEIRKYAYFVPYVEDEEKIFLKTIYPSREATKKYLIKGDELERAAYATLNKTKNINIRLSERVVSRLKAKAAEEGIPYQTLASSILHKFANQ